MGSSGMKRKGRAHLPKVGTRQSNEHELHDRRERALHPFSEDPWTGRTSSRIGAVVIALALLIGVVALIVAT
jgi:hypothetical protein